MGHLYLLLAIPVIAGIGGWLVSYFKYGDVFNWKELAVSIAAGMLVSGAGFFIALHNRTSDTEIWNGRIAHKWRERTGCCHSYPCNCHEICTGTGKRESCHEHCDTCYEHSHDIAFVADTTNGETVYDNTCNPPYSAAPTRWNAIRVGEPTAVEHSYTNYIKGNPDSVMRRQGVESEYGKLLPNYPRVYDYYRAQRFLAVGVAVPNIAKLNARLSAINADLGHRKQVDIIVLVVKTGDRGYQQALEEHWLGGKKNDVVIIVGAPDFPKIAWAGVMSWSDSEAMKIRIRDGIEKLGTFDGDKVLDIVEHEVESGFVRKPMSDFEYLEATISPSAGWLWLLYILDFLVAGGLQAWFWMNDPFGADGDD